MAVTLRDSSDSSNEITQEGTNGAAHVSVVAIDETKRPLVTPTQSLVPIGEILFDAGAGQTVDFIRLTVEPDDNLVAAQRLMDSQPEVFSISPDSVARIPLDAAITSLALVGVGSATSAAGYTIVDTEAVVGNVESAQVVLDFDSADAVQELLVTVLPRTTSNQKMRVKVQGVSYA